MNRVEAKRVRHKLKRSIARANSLAARCTLQACDGDLPDGQRVDAERKADQAHRSGSELQRTLTALDEAIETSREHRDDRL